MTSINPAFHIIVNRVTEATEHWILAQENTNERKPCTHTQTHTFSHTHTILDAENDINRNIDNIVAKLM